MRLLIYLLHYVIARTLYDVLVRHGVAPVAAFVAAGIVLFALSRRHRRRRRARASGRRAR
jgi:hypothetical protein